MKLLLNIFAMIYLMWKLWLPATLATYVIVFLLSFSQVWACSVAFVAFVLILLSLWLIFHSASIE